MNRRLVKAANCLACITTLLSAQVGAYGQDSDTTSGSRSKLAGQIKFQSAKPVLDMTPDLKLKPFTLGATEIGIRTGANDDKLRSGAKDDGGDPLKADTNFQLDPFNKRLQGDVNQNRFQLQAEEMAHLLAQYNVELIVDRSCSMGKKDCPDGLSRWQWCGEQASSLAQALAPLSPRGMTIVPFATEYDVFENASARNVETIFESMRLQGGTRLYEPLAEQFDTYFANRDRNKKPLLVVVVTDGMPVPKKIEPELVRRELVYAANRARDPHDITVIFAQIGGDDQEGSEYLEDLDQNLSQYGARYDIVHTIPFEYLMDHGLGPSLAASVRRYAPQPQVAVAPSPHKQVVKGKISGASAAHPARLPRGTNG